MKPKTNDFAERARVFALKVKEIEKHLKVVQKAVTFIDDRGGAVNIVINKDTLKIHVTVKP